MQKGSFIDLIEDFCANCTDEMQKQCLLQIDEKQRKQRKQLQGCNRKVYFMTNDNILG